MWPDYGEALFWNRDGANNGGYDSIYLDNGSVVDLSSIVGLKDWFVDWDNESLYDTSHWKEEDWQQWWLKGLILASRIKKILPSHVDFYYMWYTKNIWAVSPNDTNDGGIFAGDKPMPVPRYVCVMTYPEYWSGCAFYEDNWVGAGDGEYIYGDEGEDDIDLRNLPFFQEWYKEPLSHDIMKAAQDVRSVLPDDVELLIKVNGKFRLVCKDSNKL